MYDKEIDKLFRLAKGKVDDIEIYLNLNKSFSVRIHKQNVESFNYADSKGIGIRVLKDGKVGYSYTEEFSDKAFETIIEEAIDGSIYVENINPVVFDNYPDISETVKIYSPELDNIPVEKKIEVAKKLEQTALTKDNRVFNVPSASYSDGTAYVRIANSKGLDKEYKKNYCMAMVMVLAAEGNEKKSGYWYYAGRSFNEIDTDFIAGKAVTRAIDLLNSSSPPSGKYRVVFTPEMVSSLLSTFSGIFSAKNVQEGKSLLKGKEGTKIANASITLYDDGLHPQGFNTAPFDEEGHPTGKTVLIEEGVLKSFLHNSVTALKGKCKSTGNAGRDLRSPLTVAKSNFVIEPKSQTVQEMYNSSDRVIEIVGLQGLHAGANPISADFSLSAEGFLYEKGQRIKSLSNFTVSGNFVGMLQDVIMVGNDFSMFHNSCGAPSLLVDKLIISSKE